MMYRPHAANRPGKMMQLLRTIFSLGAHQALDLLAKVGIYEAAQRENRRRDRVNKRQSKHTTYFAAGLNGERAVARRLRQIEAGSLQVTA